MVGRKTEVGLQLRGLPEPHAARGRLQPIRVSIPSNFMHLQRISSPGRMRSAEVYAIELFFQDIWCCSIAIFARQKPLETGPELPVASGILNTLLSAEESLFVIIIYSSLTLV